jgi:RNA polymerase sigma factor (TIGR02999 family)
VSRRACPGGTAGQTLQPTALVHEAYLKLVRDQDPGWEGRRHFFGAAAQAMREILVDQARRKDSVKRGGGARRIELSEGLALIEPPADSRQSSADRLRAKGRGVWPGAPAEGPAGGG